MYEFYRRMGMMVDEMMQSDQSTMSCSALPGLSPGQNRICHIYMDHMNSVALGAKQALAECKHQFQNRRWNCSILDDVNVFGPVITFGEFSRFPLAPLESLRICINAWNVSSMKIALDSDKKLKGNQDYCRIHF